jgi:hypothetical protein
MIAFETSSGTERGMVSRDSEGDSERSSEKRPIADWPTNSDGDKDDEREGRDAAK